MTAIINATLVMRDHLIPEAVLFIEDGLIKAFGEMRTTPVPEGCEIIDADGAYVGPGFVDIHLHAGPTGRIFNEPVKSCQHHLHQGTTSMMPALYFSMNRDELVIFVITVKYKADSDIIINSLLNRQ